jgi:hypothetical protein
MPNPRRISQKRRPDGWKGSRKKRLRLGARFNATKEIARDVLRKGISIDRAFRLMDQYWNVHNKPPLPRAQLRELIETAYEKNKHDFRELRWRADRDERRAVKGRNRDSMASWLAVEDDPEDFLCGEVISTSSKTLLYAKTGKGKTTFCLALAASIAAGKDFLHWHGYGKSRRVLYIDGEMSRAVMRQDPRRANRVDIRLR